MQQFEPPRFLRNAMVQTALGSLKLNSAHNNSMLEASQEMVISGGKNICLKGSYSKNTANKPKGLFILLHGWEGSENSTYILRTGKFLFENGFHVFRLNLRDHGNTHHMNDAPFNGSLLTETYTAVYNASVLSGKLPVFICGFSLGGNFALRIALKSSVTKKKIKNLRHCIAISPAINPLDATVKMDEHKFLRKYFLSRWSKSLEKKETHFPEKYPFSKLDKSKSVMELTEKVIPKYTPFQTAYDYFESYTLTGNYLRRLTIPTTILTSKDDPIISISDFYGLIKNSFLNLHITAYGGHNGFVKNLSLDCYYLDVISEVLHTSIK